MIHKPKYDNHEKNTNRTSGESHIQCKKKHFHGNPIYFTIIADFKADNEINNSTIRDKRTKKYK